MQKKSLLYESNPDRRIIQMRIFKGEITEEDLKDYVNSLPDLSDNAEEIAVVLEDR